MKNLGRAPRSYFRGRLPGGWVVAFLFLGSSFLSPGPSGLRAAAQQQAQSSSVPANSPAQEPSSEMAVKDEATTSKVDETATFRVNVRLVLARVVVRDARGHAVGNLHKEDFELFDNGKPQVISHFAVEASGA